MSKGGKGYLHEGMTPKSPPQQAKGDPKLPKTSVAQDATRSGTAPTPKSLGGRSAYWPSVRPSLLLRRF